MSYVVDASVVVKWLISEEGSDRAAALMCLPVSAPDSLIPECLSALRKKVLRGLLSPDEADLAAGVLRSSGIVFEPLQSLARDILRLSLRLDHPPYDCAYLALARKLDAVLVTADEKFVTRCLRPDAADLAPHVRALSQVGREVQEAAASYRSRRAA